MVDAARAVEAGAAAGPLRVACFDVLATISTVSLSDCRSKGGLF
jgi:hypothetical protein